MGSPLRVEDGGADILLRDALREHPRLLLVGKAGAGKTTFIHLIACMPRGTSGSRVRPARCPGARSTSAPRATSRCCRC